MAEIMLHKEIDSLKNTVHKEQALRAEENLRASEQKKKLSEEVEKLRKMLIAYDESSRSELKTSVAIKTNPHVGKKTETFRSVRETRGGFRKKTHVRPPKPPIWRTYNLTKQPSDEGAKQIEALERENYDLKLLLTQQKTLTAKLQSEVFARKQTLLHLQDDMKELQETYERIRRLQKSKDTKTDRLVEMAYQISGGLSSRDQEDKLNAAESERNMLLKSIENLNLTEAILYKSLGGNRTDDATSHEKQAGVQTPNSSEKDVVKKVRKVKHVRFAENLVKEVRIEKDMDDVRVKPTSTSAQVKCGGSGVCEVPSACVKKKKPSDS
ncbi:hypothetical protein Q8A73_022075 [Channa argus]|nr:hypothetical protein Q8A73_022075 [Channa argus]